LCGIAAFVGKQLPPEVVRDTVLERIAHRGPDANGTRDWPGVWLGHRRLSIIDPTPGANQPMALGDHGPWIVYNGEIYNHLSLRQAGRTYRTGSDTESLLCHWVREGTRGLSLLDGIFGFVLVDGEGRVVAARDRMGVKPLYLANDPRGLWIASEIKAIPGIVGGTVPESRALLEYLRYEGVVGPATFFRGVESLAPGTWVECRPGDPSIGRGSFHAPLSEVSKEAYDLASSWSDADALDRLDDVVRSGVEAQMLSDVPIGTLCSGGVDSSLITAMVHRVDPTVQIFAVDFREPEVSERQYIERVATHLGIKVHYAILDRATFLSDLVDCIYHNDHPLSHANSVGIYRVSRLAREMGVKVLLTGEGADELFGGYEAYLRLERRLRWSRRVRWLPEGIRRRIRELLVRPEEARDTVLLRSADGALGSMAHGHLGRAAARGRARRAWEFVRNSDEREILAALSSDVVEYLEPILQRQDRMSMMAGVESRVPFLANDTVGFAASLPLRFRIRRGQGKLLLKECANRYLPHDIVARPKVGFRLPLREWIRFSSTEVFRGGFLEDEFGVRLGDRELEVPPSLSFAMLNLELWGRIFVRGEDRKELTERLLWSSGGIGPGEARA